MIDLEKIAFFASPNARHVSEGEIIDALQSLEHEYFPKERWDLTFHHPFLQGNIYHKLLLSLQNRNLAPICSDYASLKKNENLWNIIKIGENKSHLVYALQCASNLELIEHFWDESCPFYHDFESQFLWAHQEKWQQILEYADSWDMRDHFILFSACDQINNELHGDEHTLQEAISFHIGHDISSFWLQEEKKYSTYLYPKLSEQFTMMPLSYPLQGLCPADIVPLPDFSILTEKTLMQKIRTWDVESDIDHDITILWDNKNKTKESYIQEYANDYIVYPLSDVIIPPLDISQIMTSLFSNEEEDDLLVSSIYYRFMENFNIFLSYAILQKKPVMIVGQFAFIVKLFLPNAKLNVSDITEVSICDIADNILWTKKGYLPYLPMQEYEIITKNFHTIFYKILPRISF